MNKITYTTMVSRTLINHLELRKSELKPKQFIWVEFNTRTFSKEYMSKINWHEHLIAVAKSCGCEYVNVLKTDYDTKLLYFFTNPSYIEKSAMEKLQEASYAR